MAQTNAARSIFTQIDATVERGTAADMTLHSESTKARGRIVSKISLNQI